MSSPLFSALAKLDECLQAVQSQVDTLAAGLEIGDDQLRRDLAEAHQNALEVRNLLLAERPTADWTDRRALEQLMQDLEREAQLRVTEQRRSKLLALANALDAGSARHRFEARAASLNNLRLEAVRELRIAATLPDQQKELPGPEANAWLHWACNLLEESDGSVFNELRRDFPALEAFAVEMEESYWVPGEGSGAQEVPARTLEPPVPMMPEPSGDWHDWQNPAPSLGGDYRKPPHNVRVSSDTAVRSGGYATAVALGYDTQASTAPSLAETHWPIEEPAPWQPQDGNGDASKHAVAALPVKICDKCGNTYTNGFHTCTAEQVTQQAAAPATIIPVAHPANGKNGGNGAATAAQLSVALEADEEAVAEAPAAEAPEIDSSRENAEMEFHRLRAIVEQRAQETPAEEEESLGLNLTKMQIAGIAIAVCLLISIGIYAVVHYYSEKNTQAAAAAAAAAAKAPVVLSDVDMQKDIEQKLTGLKNSTVEVAVQSGVVTLTGKSSSEEEAVQAEDLTLQTNGVKVVRDRIQVDGHGVNSKPRAGKPAQH